MRNRDKRVGWTDVTVDLFGQIVCSADGGQMRQSEIDRRKDGTHKWLVCSECGSYASRGDEDFARQLYADAAGIFVDTETDPLADEGWIDLDTRENGYVNEDGWTEAGYSGDVLVGPFVQQRQSVRRGLNKASLGVVDGATRSINMAAIAWPGLLALLAVAVWVITW